MAKVTFLAGIAVGLFLTGCSGDGDSSLRIDGRGPSDIVENGTAYDRATVDIGSANRIVLPNSATVRRTGNDGPVRLFMAKRLAFAGHPPQSMSIRDGRNNMGCAITSEGNGVVIATFGEWNSIEGGADIKLVAHVPATLTVEQRSDLSGTISVARGWYGVDVSKPADAKGGYWYAPTSPIIGWSVIPDEPDPDRTAR